MKKYLFGTLALCLFLSPRALPENESDDDEDSVIDESIAPPKAAEASFDNAANQLVEAVLTASQRAALKNGNELEQEMKKICRKIVSEAIEKSKELRALRCDVLKGLGAGKNARGEFLPDLRLTGSWNAHHEAYGREEDANGKRDSTVKTEHSDTSRTGPGLTVNLEHVLFNGGASVAAVRQTNYEAKAAYANYKAKEGAAIEQMLKLAFDIIMYRLILRYSEITTTVYKEILKSELEKLNAGEVDRSEVALTEARVAKSEAKLSEIRSRLEGLEGDLLRFTGINSNDLPLVFPDLVKLLPNTIEAVKDIASKENSQLLAGHFAILASKAAINRTKAGYAPVIRLTADTGLSKRYTSSANRSNNDSKYGSPRENRDSVGSASIGLSVTLPIDIKGSVSTGLGGARQEFVKNRINADKAHGDLMSEIETYWGNLKNRKDAVDANKRHVKACMIQLQASLQELAVGAKVYTQVLKAQSDVLDAQEAYVQAEETYVLGVLHLLMMMGRLNPQAFGAEALDFNEQTSATYKDLEYTPTDKDEKNDAKKDEQTKQNPESVVYVKDDNETKIYPAKVEMRPIF
ncbi:MAG: TolC family protein [Holosporales bacterium]|nr:TolC family protein [Holosporales bacterium]